MNASHKIFMAASLFAMLSSTAFSQSSGIAWKNGNVLTANQMQQLDNSKMNLDSLGKPGFAPKLNAAGQITDPVVGDVSGATATTDGKTVSQIGQMAEGSVQKTDANQPNGYAKLDENQNVTSPLLNNTRVGGSDTGTDISNALVNSAGTSNSVAQWMEKKADVNNGSLNYVTLNGGVETTTSTDKPGAAGTSIPNTFWVDQYYQPRNTFINAYTTWTVCASGCMYSNPLDAWNAALVSNILNNSIITISIADGTYNIAGNFYTETTKTQYVHVVGNTTDNSKVILNFTGTKGKNLSGFTAYDGGKIGLIDGVTITQASDGTGALASIDSSNRQTWNAQSYGAGIQAYGAGSQIRLGSHVSVSYFYYSVVADNNGVVDAPAGGITGEHAGDANFMARGGGVIVCTPCTASYASDYTDPDNTLGSNYDAERNGSLYIDGSTGSNSLVNGLVGITGGAIWAHNTKWSGGLNGGGNGIALWSGSHAELNKCSITGYSNGADVTNASFGDLSGCTVTGMPVGLNIDGGTATGSNLVVTNNTTGINVMHNGIGIFYSTWANMTGNTTNYSVEAAGTRSPSGTSYTASSLDLQ